MPSTGNKKGTTEGDNSQKRNADGFVDEEYIKKQKLDDCEEKNKIEVIVDKPSESQGKCTLCQRIILENKDIKTFEVSRLCLDCTVVTISGLGPLLAINILNVSAEDRISILPCLFELIEQIAKTAETPEEKNTINKILNNGRKIRTPRLKRSFGLFKSIKNNNCKSSL